MLFRFAVTYLSMESFFYYGKRLPNKPRKDTWPESGGGTESLKSCSLILCVYQPRTKGLSRAQHWGQALPHGKLAAQA